MNVDADTALKAATFAMSLGAVVYSFLVNRRKDVDARFHDGTQRMNRLDKRLSEVEHTVKTLPAKDDMYNVQLELVKLNGAIDKMGAVMEGNAKVMTRVETIVSRHEDHLLDGGNK
jgi:hypothetical protein